MASDNIVRLVGGTGDATDATDTSVADALKDAAERGLLSLLILGYAPEGTLFIRSSSDISRKDALWLIESARPAIMGTESE